MIPGYSQNAVLQLIVATGIGFIAYFFTKVSMQAFAHHTAEEALIIVRPQVALPELQHYTAKWWTIFTYGWAHDGFWAWLTNMIWLYSWGSMVQMLVGHRQVIPMFVYALLAGGVFFLLAQFLPGAAFHEVPFLLGCQSGVMALAVAGITFAPRYRFYLGPNFSIPIGVIAVIYLVLAVINTNLNPTLLLSLAGGGLTGFVYVRLLQRGNRPGEWIYDLFSRIENSVTPDEHAGWKHQKKRRSHVLSKSQEHAHGISQRRIDELLEKIHKEGYNALTREEKEMLLRASKEKD